MNPKTSPVASLVALVALSTQTALAADAPTPKPDTPAQKAADKADAAADKADAAADKATGKQAGNDAVVNGNSLTETTHARGPAERFGHKGQLAMSSDSALTISSTTISGASGSTTNIELEPAVDYFVIDNLSIGGFLQFNYTSASDGHASTFGVGPRVGYNWTLSDLVSIWPKVGLSIDNTDTTTSAAAATGAGVLPGTTVSTSVNGTSVALNLYVPIMLHPAPHFFAGFGPFLDTDLSGDNRATTWGGKLTLGGWIAL
jgi:hypothetical protein